MTQTTPKTCSRCGASGTGNFCASCGSPLGPRACVSCGTALGPDAKFCPGCGAAVAGAPAGARMPLQAAPAGSKTPWIVAAVLCVVAIGSIVYSARSRNEPTGANMANAGNATGAAADPTAGVKAPDISNMTPRERFTKLSDRIQTAIEARDSNQVFQFFPMAEGAFTQLPDGDRDVDARYHMGMLWAQVGEFAKAKGQADSIMRVEPTNLFGYYMYAMLAEFRGDSTAAQKSRADFRSHYDAEIKKARPEYKDHEPFLDTYRKGAGAK
ncbi:MAG: zinc ribbon domain-containing protein [Gemmatimonadota bacterium]